MDEQHEQKALRHFKKVDPAFHKAVAKHKGTLVTRVSPKRTNLQLFTSLASSVVSQQLSTKAAQTISGRLEEACGGTVTPEAILKLRVPRLRRAGLSAAKVKTLKELSKAATSGLTLTSLARMPEEQAIETLTQIWGIGTWTAEMFLIFALGRTDVFSVGDLGLLRAMEDIYQIPQGSPKQAYLAIAERWSPYRSVASLALWRHWDSA